MPGKQFFFHQSPLRFFPSSPGRAALQPRLSQEPAGTGSPPRRGGQPQGTQNPSATGRRRGAALGPRWPPLLRSAGAESPQCAKGLGSSGTLRRPLPPCRGRARPGMPGQRRPAPARERGRAAGRSVPPHPRTSRSLCPDGGDRRASRPGPAGGTAAAPRPPAPAAQPPGFTGLAPPPPLGAGLQSAPHRLPRGRGEEGAPKYPPLPLLCLPPLRCLPDGRIVPNYLRAV